MPFDPVAYINTPRWQQSRLGLDRIRALLERLGCPQDKLRFVHVAGTNGKGSVSVCLASVLQAAGLRTGLFTSPFIERFEERIRVDGAMISPGDLREATLEVRRHAEALAEETGDHPTEFELMTAVALVHFARCGCDIAVLEVGLGGRLDSTNVIDAPEVAVIARIGRDHTAQLGTTLAAIAGEKAGIVKDGCPVVSWPQEPEAMAVVEAAAAEHGCPMHIPDFAQLAVGGVEWPGAAEAAAPAGSTAHASEGGVCGDEVHGAASVAGAAALVEGAVTDAAGLAEGASRTAAPFRSFSYKGRAFRTRLLGSYQPQNIAVVLEAVEALRARGWRIPDAAVSAGVARAEWPGRFEIIEGGTSPDGFAFVVDGGHNPQGTRALVDSLADAFPGRKAVFVIGVLEDKDYPEMLEAVLPLGSAFVAAAPDSPRALPARKLARAIRWTGQDLLGCSACVSPYEARDWEDAVARARQLAGPNGLICAFGSLYSVASVKAAARATRA